MKNVIIVFLFSILCANAQEQKYQNYIVGVNDLAPVSFQIHNGGKAIVVIHMDGRVEIDPDTNLDDAAKEFWKAVANIFPCKSK